MRNILVTAAHPDDEVYGLGGTLAKLAHEGHRIHVIIFTEGTTSRDDNDWVSETLKNKPKQMFRAGEALGIPTPKELGYADQTLDTYPILGLIKKVEHEIEEIQPDVIFTHDNQDPNRDHALVGEATITACRPYNAKSVEAIYMYETIGNPNFQPNMFVNINEYIGAKVLAMKAYYSELELSPHPRSIQQVDSLAQVRGVQGGMEYAEAFKVFRTILK